MAIKKRNASNCAQASATRSGDPEGQALVGFGKYAMMTRQALYDSEAVGHKSFVTEMLTYPVTHPAGQLDQLKKYLNKRREHEITMADDEVLVQAVQKMEKAATGRIAIFEF